MKKNQDTMSHTNGMTALGTTWPSGVVGWLLDQAIPEGVGSNPVGD